MLGVVLWILTPHFLTVSNLLNIAEQTSINAIVAGMTFVILSAASIFGGADRPLSGVAWSALRGAADSRRAAAGLVAGSPAAWPTAR